MSMDKCYGCLEKLGFSFKIKACEKFNRRYIPNIPRIKFSSITPRLNDKNNFSRFPYVLGLIGAIILFSGCATTMANIPIEDQAIIMERTIFADHETTIKAITEVFFERGYIITRSSKSSGIINTAYLSTSTCLTPFTMYLLGDSRTKVYAYTRKLDEQATKVKLRLIVEHKFWETWKRDDEMVTTEDYNKFFGLIEAKVTQTSALTNQDSSGQSQYEQQPATNPVRLWKLTPPEKEEKPEKQEKLEEEEEEEQEEGQGWFGSIW